MRDVKENGGRLPSRVSSVMFGSDSEYSVRILRETETGDWAAFFSRVVCFSGGLLDLLEQV